MADSYDLSSAAAVSVWNFGVLRFILIASLLILGTSIFVGARFIGNSTTKAENIALKDNTTPTFVSAGSLQSKYEVVGFLPSWVVAQKTPIHTDALTQLIYFGIGVNKNGELIRFTESNEPVLEWHYFVSDDFNTIRDKAAARGTKIILAIKSFDNETIDKLISNNAATNRFIAQIKSLISEHDLDGINLDFEYVTDSSFPTSRFFTLFLDNVVKALKKENSGLIVSVDVNATAFNDQAYDLAKIGEIVDQVILMTYDYHQAGSTRAGPIAPLFAAEQEHSVDKSVKALLKNIPAEKMLLGIPFYGYEWQTVGTEYKSVTIANSGALATYKRVNKLRKENSDIVVRRDKQTYSPWIVYYQGQAVKQIYYEDEQSVKKKLAYTALNNLAGIAIWALGYEGNYTTIWKPIKEMRTKK